MGYIVRMPQMGYEMEQGEVVSWEYDEGEAVAEDAILVVVESEKATNEVESREDGTLRRIVVPEGGVVEPGTPIGIVAGADEDISGYESEIESAGAAATASADDAEAATAGTGDTEAATASTGDAAAGTASASGAEAATASPDDGAATDSGRAGGVASAVTRAEADEPSTDGQQASTDSRDASEIRATPGARQRAEAEGIDLTAVEGTGPQGVVTEDDVETYALEAATASDPSSDGETADLAHEPIEAAPPEGVRASPGARRLADLEGVDLTAVEGTGPQGVVIEADVRRHAEDVAGEPTPGEPVVETGATRTVREARELSRVQQTVSDRLSESYRNAVHVTNKRRFDASTLQSVAAAAAAAGVDVSLTDLLVKAVGAELAARPAFNALFEDGRHKLIEEVNVGVAVDVEDGLVTPVLPRVTDRSVEEVAAARGELTERALSGEYDSGDLAGGTFTITNLGPFGVDSFDPVINPPEVAILGVGRVREDDTMTLSLSFDHRVVNGADAARFLGGLVETLTDPLALAAFFETDVLGAPGVDVSLSVDPDV